MSVFFMCFAFSGTFLSLWFMCGFGFGHVRMDAFKDTRTFEPFISHVI